MTAVIVTGSIILLFAVLLLSPVVVTLYYKDGDFGARIRYLLFYMSFSPTAVAKRAEKKAARATKKEFEKQAEEEETPQKEKKALADTVKTVWSYVKASKKGLDTLRRNLIFYKIRVNAVIAQEDAHQTAIMYGRVCTLVSTGLGVLSAIFPVREPIISIMPDFVSENTRADISLKIRISPLFIIVAAVQTLVRIIKVQKENKRKRQRVKGGKRNEPTKAYQ